MNVVQTKREKGFTLIELVMVIVILGILAAFALPRFADLSGDAELAVVQGAQGSVKSAMGIVRSKALATGKADVSEDSNATDAIKLEGTAIALENGYLDVNSLRDAAQLDAEEFTVKDFGEDAVITIASPADNDPCFIFTGSTDTNVPPTVSTVRSTYDDAKTAVPEACPSS